MPEPFSERDLRRLRQGDAHVIDRWVRAYADSLYTFVFYRVLKDPDLAAEVVQETFLRALRRIGDYDPQRGSALVWLTYLSKNISVFPVSVHEPRFFSVRRPSPTENARRDRSDNASGKA